MRKSICLGALLYLLITSLLSSGYPVLDEEGYIYIAQNISFQRPYEWSLPWPPYTDSYRYAHPPLFLFWVKLCMFITGKHIWALKFVLGLPFRLLLGGSVGWLFHELARHPRHAFLFWGCSPVVLLIGARACMPDLMLCALGSTAMAIIFCARFRAHTYVAGVFLALACWVKYPALLLWVPIWYALGDWKSKAKVAVAFAVIWLGGELWLYSLYGDIHLLTVLKTADHVERGTFMGRGLGILMRLLIAAPCLMLVYSRRMWLWLPIMGLIWALFLPELSLTLRLGALLWVSFSAVLLLWSVRRMDVLSIWVITVVMGVWVGHNFAAPRYLGMAMPALVSLIDREPISKYVMGFLCSGSFLLSLAMAYSEHMQAEATDSLMQDMPKDAYVCGEWTIRWSARHRDMAIWKGETVSVIQPKQAVGCQVPIQYRFLRSQESSSGIRLMLDRAHSVSFYSETLGFWPVGFHYGPREELRVWNP